MKWNEIINQPDGWILMDYWISCFAAWFSERLKTFDKKTTLSYKREAGGKISNEGISSESFPQHSIQAFHLYSEKVLSVMLETWIQPLQYVFECN
jgi:hypothetical protein